MSRLANKGDKRQGQKKKRINAKQFTIELQIKNIEKTIKNKYDIQRIRVGQGLLLEI